MKFLIVSALITLTMPGMFVDGTLLPTGKKLTAIVYRVGEVEPVAALVAYPNEIVSVQVPQDFGSWYAVGWNIGTIEPSVNSEIVTKTPSDYDGPPCGAACHQ